MKRFLNRLVLTVIVGASSLGFFSSCHRGNRAVARYDFKGKVVSVDKAKQQITVAHEEVKGYMPAMVMPFKLRDAWPFDVLAPDDQIAATLVVDGGNSWLEDVVIREAGSATATASGDAGTAAKPGDEVPNYGLVNQDDKLIKVQNYRGQALMLTFIYTRCPDPNYCTLMSSRFALLDQLLQKEPDLYGRTHLLSISFDPSYDTPAVLRSYGASYTGRYSDEKFEHWEFASGSMDQVKGIAQYFGLRYYQGTDQIIHDLKTAIIAPGGKVFKVYSGNEWTPEEAMNDLREAAKSR
jgi:protein SCO1/2